MKQVVKILDEKVRFERLHTKSSATITWRVYRVTGGDNQFIGTVGKYKNPYCLITKGYHTFHQTFWLGFHFRLIIPILPVIGQNRIEVTKHLLKDKS